MTLAAAPRISVLVPARNEATALGPLLDALLRQDYPPDQFEVIVVDDRSTDGTGRVAAEGGEDLVHFRLLRIEALQHGLEGKQNALEAGIRAARGRIIVQTDADCLPPPHFLSTYAAAFEANPGLAFAFGRTGMTPARGLLPSVQSADLLFLFFMAVLAEKAGHPLTCMGNNIAYLRERYLALGGYPALGPSRIEDYQLLTAFRGKGWEIRFIKTRGPLNLSHPVGSGAGFFYQRLRWARGVLVFNPLMNALAVLWLLMDLAALTSLAALLLTPSTVWALLLGTKLFLDGLLFTLACVYFREPRIWPGFFVWEPYALVSPVAYAIMMGRAPRWR
ncbi:MAG: glycosyltransferase [Fibrobacterota bacterium]